MLFFTHFVFDLIVEQTNLYYMQVNAAKPSPMIWFDTCVEEMQAFFGVIIAMGVVRMPEFDDYWSTDPIFRNSWFSSIFSRDRFKQILRYLHCADNSKRPDRNAPGYKLFKVQALIDTLNLSFRNLYTPKQNLSIDESMVGTKCRVSFIQYMSKKPKKLGIKLWTLCEAETGYCLQFQVYTGKTENDSGEVQAEHGLTYRVVFDLMKYYFDKGYVVFLDNFYTSYQLFVDLLSKGTGACGTVRSNRFGYPKQLQGKRKMEKGEAIFYCTNGVTAVRWFDKRDVHALSTIHGNEMVSIPPRRSENQPVSKPMLIVDYNRYMNGVDRCDQLLTYYALNRRSTKWWKKVFFRLLDLCIINSMVLYFSMFPEKGAKRQAHKQFRMELAHELVQPLLDRNAESDSLRTPCGRPCNSDEVRLKGKHFAISQQPRRRCVVCAYQKGESGKLQNKKTVNFCPKCNKYVCKDCFEFYHTRSTLK